MRKGLLITTLMLGGAVVSGLLFVNRRDPDALAAGTVSEPNVKRMSTVEKKMLGEMVLLEEKRSVRPVVEDVWQQERLELKGRGVRDPIDALNQVSAIHNKEERKAAAMKICRHLSETDPALAVEAALVLEVGRDGSLAGRNTLCSLAKTWAKADLMAALEWAMGQPGDPDGCMDQIVKGIAFELSRTMPREAASLVVLHMTPGDHAQFIATMDVVRQWGAVDFDAALSWVDQFPEGPTRDRALDELAKASVCDL